MKAYLSFFRIRFIAGLQYRAAAWAGVSTQFAWGAMNLLMFRAFWRQNPDAFPMTFSQLSTYIWLQQALLAMFMAWYFDDEIFSSVTTGGIAYELCRPCDLYAMWFTKNMATRLSKALLRCVPILLIAVFLPSPYRVTLPAGVAAGLLFPVSLLLGYLVLIAFSMLIYISAFYTLSPMGIRILATSVTEFFSGSLIPVPFFPAGLQTVMNVLPFASMQNTPFLIYIGYITPAQAPGYILVQLAWLAVLLLTGLLLMRHALRRVTVQGG